MVMGREGALKATHIYYLTVLVARSLNCVLLGYNPGVGRAAFLSGGSRGESVSLPFPAATGCLLPLAHGPLFHVHSQQCYISLL